MANASKLDNPVWHSLNETHKKFSVSLGNLKCYQPDYCALGGYSAPGRIAENIDQYAKLISSFFIVGEKPRHSSNLALEKELVCLQMIWDGKLAAETTEDIIRLNNTHDKALFDLVNLVQPGYFKNKTMLLGDYYGIFKTEMLVAVIGERMKMNDFTEVSAVVTHPDHLGKGYAKQLVGHTVNKILGEKKTPYLHVAETNEGAIALYGKSGFRTRTKISFWNFTKIE